LTNKWVFLRLLFHLSGISGAWQQFVNSPLATQTLTQPKQTALLERHKTAGREEEEDLLLLPSLQQPRKKSLARFQTLQIYCPGKKAAQKEVMVSRKERGVVLRVARRRHVIFILEIDQHEEEN
jgi:hypothetical protein